MNKKINFQKKEIDESKPLEYLRVLGSGSFGKVYLAKDKESEKEFAVKVNYIDPQIDGIGRINELQLMIAVKHIYINGSREIYFEYPLDRKVEVDSDYVKRKDLKLDNYYIIMDRASCSLDVYLNSTRYSSIVGQISSIMTQILLGLEYLHAKGICHRDLRPDNILYFKEEEDGQFYGKVKISDLGLGKTLDPHLGNTTMIVNRYYRPPEIACMCRIYTLSVDIWSLGIIFFRLLSGGSYLYSPNSDSNETTLKLIHQLIPLDGITYPESNDGILERVSKIKSLNLLRATLEEKIKKEALVSFINEGDSEEQVFNSVIDLLVKMLDPNMKRITASEILNLDLFKKERQLIDEMRIETKISNDGKWLGDKDLIISVQSKIRDEVINDAIDLYNNRNNKTSKGKLMYPFYTNQIWSASVDLFDRWHAITKNPTKTKALNAFYVCFYIMIKMLNGRAHYRFTEVYQQWNSDFENLEFSIINSFCRTGIYRRTIYEYLKDFDDEKMPSLVRFVKSLPNYNGISISKLARSFENQILNNERANSS